jgi:homoserine O-acetyltransferase
MHAIAEVRPIEPEHPPRCPPAESVREGVFDIPGGLALHHGGVLPAVRVAWRMAGAANAPLVCALGGISASRRVCLTEQPRQSWWREVAGPARPLDTDRYRVLSFDYLGGSGETTGPRAGECFPSISTYDQAEVLVRLLDHLRIQALRAIVGGSYGGMVALAFAERFPERVAQLIVLCAADRPYPLASAWRSVQRDIVRLGIEAGRPAESLALARALGMSTYRSGEEFAARFSGPAVFEQGRARLPVERYLAARGADYAARHLPEAFLCLSESIDLHTVEAERICVPTAVVGVREDLLVPLTEVRALAARLRAARLFEISSIYGHDAFLKESQQLRGVFAAVLENLS